MDGDQPITGKVYHRFFSLMEHIREMDMDDDRKAPLLEFTEKRWNDAHSDMHAAGYATDPEFRTHDYTSNEEVRAFALLIHCYSSNSSAICADAFACMASTACTFRHCRGSMQALTCRYAYAGHGGPGEDAKQVAQ